MRKYIHLPLQNLDLSSFHNHNWEKEVDKSTYLTRKQNIPSLHTSSCHECVYCQKGRGSWAYVIFIKYRTTQVILQTIPTASTFLRFCESFHEMWGLDPDKSDANDFTLITCYPPWFLFCKGTAIIRQGQQKALSCFGMN